MNLFCGLFTLQTLFLQSVITVEVLILIIQHIEDLQEELLNLILLLYLCHFTLHWSIQYYKT